MNILNFLNNLIFKTVYAQETVQSNLPFTIPSLIEILAFLIRFMLIVAGLAALIFLVLGALSWVTSSGEKEKVTKAQEKIQAAVVGLVVLVAVLALIVTLETIVFKDTLCLGVTCDISKTMPQLLKKNPNYSYSGQYKMSVKVGGTGYSIGDILTLSPGGNKDARVRVSKLGANGAVSEVTTENDGTGYDQGSSYVTVGGGDNGCQIKIDKIVP